MYTLPELRKILDNEQLLLVLLSRLYFGTATKAEVHNFLHEHPVAYDKFHHLIALHNVRPFVYHILSAHSIETDAAFLLQLKAFCLYNQKRSMEQAVIASRLLTGLRQKNIGAIAFKGPGFSYRYYGNLALRESTDIDLLVSEKDIETIELYCKENGYQPRITVPAAYMPYYKKYFKEIVYSAALNPGGDTYSVEFHWKLVNIFFGTYPGYSFFEPGRMEHPVGALPFTQMQPTHDFIAVASNHFVKDMSIKFKYLIDMAAMMDKSGTDLDVAMITQVTEEHRCRKKYEQGLFIISQLLGKELPGYTFKYSFGKLVVRQPVSVPLFVKKFDVKNSAFLRSALGLQDNPAEKGRFLRRCLFYLMLPTDNDIRAWRFRQPMLPLLVLLRPFRMMRRLNRKDVF